MFRVWYKFPGKKVKVRVVFPSNEGGGSSDLSFLFPDDAGWDGGSLLNSDQAKYLESLIAGDEELEKKISCRKVEE